MNRFRYVCTRNRYLYTIGAILTVTTAIVLLSADVIWKLCKEIYRVASSEVKEAYYLWNDTFDKGMMTNDYYKAVKAQVDKERL